VRYEIGMSGSGGQGTILLGAILAEAASLKETFFVAQTQSYDPAVRGGKAEANLIISDEEIDWPGVFGLDILLALSQDACTRNIGKLKPDGILVVDPDMVNNISWGKVLRIPFTQIARTKFKDERVVNMIGAGCLTKLIGFIPDAAVQSAISSNFKAKVLELNLNAFKEGIDCAEKALAKGFEQVKTSEDM
jgi:2-oxoglutarate ferredoxin oxidoreductase subunit gamma